MLRNIIGKESFRAAIFVSSHTRLSRQAQPTVEYRLRDIRDRDEEPLLTQLCSSHPQMAGGCGSSCGKMNTILVACEKALGEDGRNTFRSLVCDAPG
jgi:hypothetical protein